MATTGAAASNITEQFVREAPDIEAYKLGLMQSAQALKPPALPDYQIAGMAPQQQAAIQQGQAGIGAYLPYMQAGTQNVGQAAGTIGEAANVLRGADTRNQFGAAQQAYNMSAMPAAQMGQAAGLAGAGLGYLGAGGQDIDYAQQMAQAYGQANLQPSQQMMMNAAQQAQQAAYQPGFGQAQNVLGAGIGSLAGAAQAYNPNSVQGFMNPYQQQVIDESIKQINRQGAQANEALDTQAIRAGAFGGGRDAVMKAEMQRNLADAKNAAITNTLSQGYGTAQQQAMQAFQQQQANQLAQGQGLNQAAGQAGALAAQQAGLQQAGAQYAGNVGQNIGAQQLQQAGLGQSAASLYGQLGSQQAGLAGQYANIAGQQANILGQQSQLQQSLGQGIGNLASQQFGVGQNLAQGLGSLGTQLGNMGIQQAALGQTQQQLGQNDTNFLYNLGAQQQKQQQAVLDAQRATSMQNAMQPYQQLAFQSDIYKGAPSTQMAITQQQAAAPSPFQQIAGVGTGILGLAGAANAAGKLF